MRYLALGLIGLLLVFGGTLHCLHYARWNTSLGSFTAELHDEQTPITG